MGASPQLNLILGRPVCWRRCVQRLSAAGLPNAAAEGPVWLVLGLSQRACGLPAHPSHPGRCPRQRGQCMTTGACAAGACVAGEACQRAAQVAGLQGDLAAARQRGDDALKVRWRCCAADAAAAAAFIAARQAVRHALSLMHLAAESCSTGTRCAAWHATHDAALPCCARWHPEHAGRCCAGQAREAADLEARSAKHKARWTGEQLVRLEQCAPDSLGLSMPSAGSCLASVKQHRACWAGQLAVRGRRGA